MVFSDAKRVVSSLQHNNYYALGPLPSDRNWVLEQVYDYTEMLGRKAVPVTIRWIRREAYNAIKYTDYHAIKANREQSTLVGAYNPDAHLQSIPACVILQGSAGMNEYLFRIRRPFWSEGKGVCHREPSLSHPYRFTERSARAPLQYNTMRGQFQRRSLSEKREIRESSTPGKSFSTVVSSEDSEMTDVS